MFWNSRKTIKLLLRKCCCCIQGNKKIIWNKLIKLLFPLSKDWTSSLIHFSTYINLVSKHGLQFSPPGIFFWEEILFALSKPIPSFGPWRYVGSSDNTGSWIFPENTLDIIWEIWIKESEKNIPNNYYIPCFLWAKSNISWMILSLIAIRPLLI